MNHVSYLPEEQLDDDDFGLLGPVAYFQKKDPGVEPVTSDGPGIAEAVAVLVLSGALSVRSLPGMAAKADAGGAPPVAKAIRRAHRVLLRDWFKQGARR